MTKLDAQISEVLNILRKPNAPNTPSDGSPAIDPTLNVKEALASAVKRLDDIRDVDSEHRKEIREIEDRCAKEVRELRDQLGRAETERINAQALAESRRLDAQRAEDKSAVALANTRAELTAANLAQQVVTTEKTLAAAAEASAKTLATAFETAIKGLVDRVIPLEQARYQQVGGKEQQVESRVSRVSTGVTITQILSIVLGAIFIAGLLFDIAVHFIPTGTPANTTPIINVYTPGATPIPTR